MPNTSVVDVNVRNKTFPRYQAPHVQNQNGSCPQLAASIPGYDVDQPVIGCDPSCNNGCVSTLPSMYNPGPSFTSSDGSSSVQLIRIHKATAHFTCVRVLLILKKQHTDPKLNKLRHQYAMARVIMKPAPGNAVNDTNAFYKNILTGTYSKTPVGYWQAFQTGTTGLRNMDPNRDSGPAPADLQFSGVTQDGMDRMPFQMECWDSSCLGKQSCSNMCS